MVCFLPFCGVRPKDNLVEIMSCPPYDVVSSEEARSLAVDPRSFLRITRPEVDILGLDEHDPKVYSMAAKNYQDFKSKGYLIKDPQKSFYIYEQTLGSTCQTGIVGLASCKEYESGIIKKHEYTRKDKEADRVSHIKAIKANSEPVFFAYKSNQNLHDIIYSIKQSSTPLYSFIDSSSTGHKLWRCINKDSIDKISSIFKTSVDNFYIADGHHRSSAAYQVYKDYQKLDNYSKDAEYNYFLAVCFPEDELCILSYNRLVKDLYGLSYDEFFSLVSKKFDIKKIDQFGMPKHSKSFCMYLDHTSYELEAKNGSFNEDDPVLSLDASILQDNLLEPILGIKDPRTDSRIGFVGGIKPASYLAGLVDSQTYRLAFYMYPVSMSQIISTANSGKVMPPKSTWFEPKLKSGLFIHEF